MSERLERIDREAHELAGAFELTSQNDVPVAAIDLMEDFKHEVLGFFKNRIASISRSEKIKKLMFEQLEQDIESGALTFDQKMALLMRLNRDDNDAADAIISMFRPSGNGQGSLLTDIVRPGSDKSDLAKAIEKYSPEELRKINETFKVIRDIVETGGTVSVETQGGSIPVAEL